MTRTTALVLSVSLLLLGGAWLLSRALTTDIPVPQGVLPPPPLPQEPGVVAAPRPPPPVLAPEVVTSPPPEPEPLARAPQPPPPPPPPPVEAPSPEQVELDTIAAQGWAQLKDERGGPANWRRAEKMFIRCLTLSPDNQTCKEGATQARQRLGPKWSNRPAFPVLVPVQDPPPPDPEQ